MTDDQSAVAELDEQAEDQEATQPAEAPSLMDDGPMIEGYYDTALQRKAIKIDGISIDIRESQRLVNQSQDFEWGYGGSGPAQTALAILLKVTGDVEKSKRNYQTFKWDVISGLNKGAFRLPVADVRAWVKEKAS